MARAYNNAKKAAKRAEVIEAMLVAARAAFDERGFDGFSIREFARSQGVTFGAVYAKFASKADLFEKAMGRPAPDVGRFLEGLIAAAIYEPVEPFQADALALRRDLFGKGALI